MANTYKPASHYKELTVKVNQTYVMIKDRNVYINGQVRPALPFKNDQITVKRETTLFFVLTGNHASQCVFVSANHVFLFVVVRRSWISNSIRWCSCLHSFGSLIREQHARSLRHLRFQ